jgi:hypothetical protein
MCRLMEGAERGHRRALRRGYVSKIPTLGQHIATNFDTLSQEIVIWFSLAGGLAG